MAGRVLPGFSSPDDPQFDLFKERKQVIYAGINTVLRSLLSDDPTRRLQVLEALPTRVNDLIRWAEEKHEEEIDSGLRDQLAMAGEAMAKTLTISPAKAEEPDHKVEAERFASMVAESWDAAATLEQIKNDLIGPHAGSLAVRVNGKTAHLRSLLQGAFVRTVRWSPKIGQEGSLSPNPKENDPHVQETTSA